MSSSGFNTLNLKFHVFAFRDFSSLYSFLTTLFCSQSSVSSRIGKEKLITDRGLPGIRNIWHLTQEPREGDGCFDICRGSAYVKEPSGCLEKNLELKQAEIPGVVMQLLIILKI